MLFRSGIAEVWQYTQRDSVVIHCLTGDNYAEAKVSLAFSQLTVVQLNQFLSDYQDDIQLTRDIRRWVDSLN